MIEIQCRLDICMSHPRVGYIHLISMYMVCRDSLNRILLTDSMHINGTPSRIPFLLIPDILSSLENGFCDQFLYFRFRICDTNVLPLMEIPLYRLKLNINPFWSHHSIPLFQPHFLISGIAIKTPSIGTQC